MDVPPSTRTIKNIKWDIVRDILIILIALALFYSGMPVHGTHGTSKSANMAEQQSAGIERIFTPGLTLSEYEISSINNLLE